MVLRLRQHNIGYMADGFYRSDDPTNSVGDKERLDGLFVKLRECELRTVFSCF